MGVGKTPLQQDYSMRERVIAVFDVGKTNKKLFLFNEEYKIVFERSARLNEVVDEDGFPCESIDSLRLSVYDALQEVGRNQDVDLCAVNFSSYGASFVNLDKRGQTLTPLYNYLKEYPKALTAKFFDSYGKQESFSLETASPILGSLNSGLQLYRLKYENPSVFNEIQTALHLPQYLSYLVTGKLYSDLTSIGCHTGLWNYENNDYHSWVYQENIVSKLGMIYAGDAVIPASFQGKSFLAGAGLHDSSAAIIPYLLSFTEPFILISTGTWAISMNPFDLSPLTPDDLKNDCLKYLQFSGKPVKAARVFIGYEHEQQTSRIAEFFGQKLMKYRALRFEPDIITILENKKLIPDIPFEHRDLAVFADDTEAYYQLIVDLIGRQKRSTGYVLKNTLVKRIFVDGGFSKNAIYMHLLAAAFPALEVFAASMAQATAVGTALAIHNHWNTRALPNDLIELKYYATNHTSLI